jgi:hypothetical protein
VAIVEFLAAVGVVAIVLIVLVVGAVLNGLLEIEIDNE